MTDTLQNRNLFDSFLKNNTVQKPEVFGVDRGGKVTNVTTLVHHEDETINMAEKTNANVQNKSESDFSDMLKPQKRKREPLLDDFCKRMKLGTSDATKSKMLIPSQTGPCGTKQSSVLSEPPTHGSFPHSRAENETPSPGPCSLPPGVPVETPLDLSKNKFVFSGNQNSRTFISGKPIDLSIKPSNASSELPSDCSTPCSQTNSPKVSRTSDAEISSSVISSSSNLPVLLDAGSKQVSPVRPIVEATSDFFGQMKKKFSHFSLSSTSLHQLGEDSTVSVSSSVSPIDPSSLDECQYRLLGKACGCAKCTFSKFQKNSHNSELNISDTSFTNSNSASDNIFRPYKLDNVKSLPAMQDKSGQGQLNTGRKVVVKAGNGISKSIPLAEVHPNYQLQSKSPTIDNLSSAVLFPLKDNNCIDKNLSASVGISPLLSSTVDQFDSKDLSSTVDNFANCDAQPYKYSAKLLPPYSSTPKAKLHSEIPKCSTVISDSTSKRFSVGSINLISCSSLGSSAVQPPSLEACLQSDIESESAVREKVHLDCPVTSEKSDEGTEIIAETISSILSEPVPDAFAISSVLATDIYKKATFSSGIAYAFNTNFEKRLRENFILSTEYFSRICGWLRPIEPPRKSELQKTMCKLSDSVERNRNVKSDPTKSSRVPKKRSGSKNLNEKSNLDLNLSDTKILAGASQEPYHVSPYDSDLTPGCREKMTEAERRLIRKRFINDNMENVTNGFSQSIAESVMSRQRFIKNSKDQRFVKNSKDKKAAKIDCDQKDAHSRRAVNSSVLSFESNNVSSRDGFPENVVDIKTEPGIEQDAVNENSKSRKQNQIPQMRITFKKCNNDESISKSSGNEAESNCVTETRLPTNSGIAELNLENNMEAKRGLPSLNSSKHERRKNSEEPVVSLENNKRKVEKGSKLDKRSYSRKSCPVGSVDQPIETEIKFESFSSVTKSKTKLPCLTPDLLSKKDADEPCSDKRRKNKLPQLPISDRELKKEIDETLPNEMLTELSRSTVDQQFKPEKKAQTQNKIEKSKSRRSLPDKLSGKKSKFSFYQSNKQVNKMNGSNRDQSDSKDSDFSSSNEESKRKFKRSVDEQIKKEEESREDQVSVDGSIKKEFDDSSSTEDSKPKLSSSGKKRSSMLNQIRSSDGFVGDRNEKHNENLFVEPCKLSREERKLRIQVVLITKQEVQHEWKKTKDSKKIIKAESIDPTNGDESNKAKRGSTKKGTSKQEWSKTETKLKKSDSCKLSKEKTKKLVEEVSNKRRASKTSSNTAQMKWVYRCLRRRNKLGKTRWQNANWKRRSSICNKTKFESNSEYKRSLARQDALSLPLSVQTDVETNHNTKPSDRLFIVKDEVHDPPANDCLSRTQFSVPLEVKKLCVCHNTGETVLHKAARLGYKDVARWCCASRYVCVNTTDNAGFTPLHEACISSKTDVARDLIHYGADVNAAARQDGTRPLFEAVNADCLEMVRLLLSHGADITLTTYSGKTVSDFASSNEMRNFLKAYLWDMNVSEGDNEEMEWCFAPIWDKNRPVDDILSDIPSDDDVLDEIDFTVSDEPWIT